MTVRSIDYNSIVCADTQRTVDCYMGVLSHRLVLGPAGLVVQSLRPIARFGGDDCAAVGRVFSLTRPRVDKERDGR